MDSSKRKRVLFLCTHNSARSQMAEGLLRAFHGHRFDSFSAGTEATRVKPMAVEVMAELGVDISSQYSKVLDEYLHQPMDIVVTVCDSAKEQCPHFPLAGVQIHKAFADPSDVTQSPDARRTAFRNVRDQIRAWLDTEFA